MEYSHIYKSFSLSLVCFCLSQPSWVYSKTARLVWYLNITKCNLPNQQSIGKKHIIIIIVIQKLCDKIQFS